MHSVRNRPSRQRNQLAPRIAGVPAPNWPAAPEPQFQSPRGGQLLFDPPFNAARLARPSRLDDPDLSSSGEEKLGVQQEAGAHAEDPRIRENREPPKLLVRPGMKTRNPRASS